MARPCQGLATMTMRGADRARSPANTPLTTERH